MNEPNNQEQTSMTPESVSDSQVENVAKKPGTKMGVFVTIAVLAVVVAAVVYFFVSPAEVDTEVGIAPDAVIATVNGTEVLGADLTTSINQIAATAQLQGMDTTDPEVQAGIQAQAVDMLVNTELLKQEADARGIMVTDSEVEDRIAALVAEIGSEEALSERMIALGIDEEMLQRDVRGELMIQELLDQVFAESDTDVTEEEIASLYDTTVGDTETAPALEDMRSQIEAQIQISKEQVAVDELISELREQAEVTIEGRGPTEEVLAE